MGNASSRDAAARLRAAGSEPPAPPSTPSATPKPVVSSFIRSTSDDAPSGAYASKPPAKRGLARFRAMATAVELHNSAAFYSVALNRARSARALSPGLSASSRRIASPMPSDSPPAQSSATLESPPAMAAGPSASRRNVFAGLAREAAAASAARVKVRASHDLTAAAAAAAAATKTAVSTTKSRRLASSATADSPPAPSGQLASTADALPAMAAGPSVSRRNALAGLAHDAAAAAAVREKVHASHDLAAAAAAAAAATGILAKAASPRNASTPSPSSSRHVRFAGVADESSAGGAASPPSVAVSQRASPSRRLDTVTHWQEAAGVVALHATAQASARTPVAAASALSPTPTSPVVIKFSGPIPVTSPAVPRVSPRRTSAAPPPPPPPQQPASHAPVFGPKPPSPLRPRLKRSPPSMGKPSLPSPGIVERPRWVTVWSQKSGARASPPTRGEEKQLVVVGAGGAVAEGGEAPIPVAAVLGSSVAAELASIIRGIASGDDSAVLLPEASLLPAAAPPSPTPTGRSLPQAPSTPLLISVKSPPRADKVCSTCGKAGARQICGGCLAARYCDVACQRNHWDAHEAACSVHERMPSLESHSSRGLFGDATLVASPTAATAEAVITRAAETVSTTEAATTTVEIVEDGGAATADATGYAPLTKETPPPPSPPEEESSPVPPPPTMSLLD